MNAEQWIGEARASYRRFIVAPGMVQANGVAARLRKAISALEAALAVPGAREAIERRLEDG